MGDTDQLVSPMQVPGMPGQPTPVTQPQDDSDQLEQSLLGASEQGRQLVAEQIARARQAAGQANPLIQAQGQEPIPQMGFQPHFGGGILHDIGQALLAVGAATGPGKAIQNVKYGPAIRQYETKQGVRAKQIDELQKQQQLEEEPIPSASGMVYRPYGAIMQGKRVGVEQQRADTYAQSVQNRAQFNQQLMALDQAKLGESQRHNRVTEMIGQMGVNVQEERNQVILSLGGQRISVDQAKFDAAVNNKNQGFFDQIFTSLGLKQFQGTGGDTAPVDITSPTAKAAAGAGKTAVKGAVKPQPKQVIKWGRDASGNPVRLSK